MSRSSLTVSLNYSHWLTQSHLFIHSSIHSFTHSQTHHSNTYSFTHSFSLSNTNSFSHSLKHSLTHSPIWKFIYFEKKNAEDKYTRNSAFSEKEAIGFATYFFGYNGDCGRMLYLEDIYIEPVYRSKGYGTAVFKYMAKVGFNLIMFFFFFIKYWNIYIVFILH